MANNLTLNDLGRTLRAQLYQIITGGDEHAPHTQKRWSERSRGRYRLNSENLAQPRSCGAAIAAYFSAALLKYAA